MTIEVYMLERTQGKCLLGSRDRSRGTVFRSVSDLRHVTVTSGTRYVRMQQSS